MTITNGYCTLDEIKRELAIESLHILADAVLERAIEDASRMVDAYCARQFYAAAASGYYDVPEDSTLWMGDDWVSVSSVVNGDGTAIAASLYDAWPRNAVSKVAVRLKDSSGLSWAANSGGDEIGVITVTGSSGYVDRAASDAKSALVISNTKRAALIIASALYRKRTGQETQAATVTGAGVVLTPQGIPRDAVQLLEGYRRMA